MREKEDRRKSIDDYGEIISIKDIEEYLCISGAYAEKIACDSRLKKIDLPIKKTLIMKKDFIEYLSM